MDIAIFLMFEFLFSDFPVKGLRRRWKRLSGGDDEKADIVLAVILLE
ncbi:MAG: hypothetical protein PHI66_03750 [Candidatus Pacebacteria bacterium]|nr:hypothetical protein [Candidatus Paceibacterota bacterium]